MGANVDQKKVQLVAPNTTTGSALLSNSYVNELDLQKISESIDLEMATMLDPDWQALKAVASEQKATAQKDSSINAVEESKESVNRTANEAINASETDRQVATIADA